MYTECWTIYSYFGQVQLGLCPIILFLLGLIYLNLGLKMTSERVGLLGTYIGLQASTLFLKFVELHPNNLQDLVVYFLSQSLAFSEENGYKLLINLTNVGFRFVTCAPSVEWIETFCSREWAWLDMGYRTRPLMTRWGSRSCRTYTALEWQVAVLCSSCRMRSATTRPLIWSKSVLSEPDKTDRSLSAWRSELAASLLWT